GSSRKRYVSYFRYALLERVKEDNVIYHGLAGHFFLEGLSHLLKVRILADMDDRAQLESEREGIPFDKAKNLLKKDDEERRKWSMQLYNMDPQDPSIYDMVLHIKKLGTEDAVDLICEAVQKEQFQSTDASRQAVEDMLLAAEAKVRLVEKFPDAEVFAEKGNVNVKMEGLYDQEEAVKKKVEELVSQVPGVQKCSVSMVYMDR
ncbi:MAG: cytidylate kinase-like family protein, partial [bacterium]